MHSSVGLSPIPLPIAFLNLDGMHARLSEVRARKLNVVLHLLKRCRVVCIVESHIGLDDVILLEEWASKRQLLCFSATSAEEVSAAHDGRSPKKAAYTSSSRWEFLGHGRWQKVFQGDIHDAPPRADAEDLTDVNLTVEEFERLKGGCTIFMTESFASGYDIVATCIEDRYLLRLRFTDKLSGSTYDVHKYYFSSTSSSD